MYDNYTVQSYNAEGSGGANRTPQVMPTSTEGWAYHKSGRGGTAAPHVSMSASPVKIGGKPASRQEMETNKFHAISSQPSPSSATSYPVQALPDTHFSVPSSYGVATPQLIAKSTPCSRRRRKGPQAPGRTATDKERHFVQHNYHDLVNEPYSSCVNESSGLSDDSFPMKLHRMLNEIENEGNAHIISWQPHGRAVLIRDMALFTRIIMPRYFPKSKKITSIQRQFNLYGFEKLARDGPDHGAYYHEAFLRGRPELTSQRMVRKRVKGTGHKACSNPNAEPDFYSMPFVNAWGRSNSAVFHDGLNSSHDPTLQYQARLQRKSTTQNFDNEPIDFFAFDWHDTEI